MNEPVRILQIVPNMQQGGLENFIMNIYRNIDRTKIQFDFLVHYQERKFFDDEIEKMGGRIYRFSLRDDNNILKYIEQLNEFYKKHKEYKIIHCHMSSIGTINFLIARKNNIRIKIAHSHNSATEKSLKGIMKRLLMQPYRYVSDINFACSESAGKYLFKNKKFEVIPNAINTKKFMFNKERRKEYREKLGINEKRFVIGHVGRFNVQKNHKFIIEIFNEYLKKNKRTVLLLIGDGELIEETKLLCKKLKIEKSVIFLKNVSNVYDYYNTMDLFILPSLFEGLPVVGIEAQTNGLNCLFSNRITDEAKLTDGVEYLDLDPKIWVEKFEQKFVEIEKDRLENYNKISNSEFEITKVSKIMQEKYLSFIKD